MCGLPWLALTARGTATVMSAVRSSRAVVMVLSESSLWVNLGALFSGGLVSALISAAVLTSVVSFLVLLLLVVAAALLLFLEVLLEVVLLLLLLLAEVVAMVMMCLVSTPS